MDGAASPHMDLYKPVPISPRAYQDTQDAPVRRLDVAMDTAPRDQSSLLNSRHASSDAMSIRRADVNVATASPSHVLTHLPTPSPRGLSTLSDSPSNIVSSTQGVPTSSYAAYPLPPPPSVSAGGQGQQHIYAQDAEQCRRDESSRSALTGSSEVSMQDERFRITATVVYAHEFDNVTPPKPKQYVHENFMLANSGHTNNNNIAHTRDDGGSVARNDESPSTAPRSASHGAHPATSSHPSPIHIHTAPNLSPGFQHMSPRSAPGLAASGVPNSSVSVINHSFAAQEDLSPRYHVPTSAPNGPSGQVVHKGPDVYNHGRYNLEHNHHHAHHDNTNINNYHAHHNNTNNNTNSHYDQNLRSDNHVEPSGHYVNQGAGTHHHHAIQPDAREHEHVKYHNAHDGSSEIHGAHRSNADHQVQSNAHMPESRHDQDSRGARHVLSPRHHQSAGINHGYNTTKEHSGEQRLVSPRSLSHTNDNHVVSSSSSKNKTHDQGRVLSQRTHNSKSTSSMYYLKEESEGEEDEEESRSDDGRRVKQHDRDDGSKISDRGYHRENRDRDRDREISNKNVRIHEDRVSWRGGDRRSPHADGYHDDEVHVTPRLGNGKTREHHDGGSSSKPRHNNVHQASPGDRYGGSSSRRNEAYAYDESSSPLQRRRQSAEKSPRRGDADDNHDHDDGSHVKKGKDSRGYAHREREHSADRRKRDEVLRRQSPEQDSQASDSSRRTRPSRAQVDQGGSQSDVTEDEVYERVNMVERMVSKYDGVASRSAEKAGRHGLVKHGSAKKSVVTKDSSDEADMRRQVLVGKGPCCTANAELGALKEQFEMQMRELEDRGREIDDKTRELEQQRESIARLEKVSSMSFIAIKLRDRTMSVRVSFLRIGCVHLS
jgi:hypothetical protein